VSRETGWNPKALEEGPKVLWRINVGFGYSNVAIEDDRLYTMGRKREKNDINNFVLCLDARSGKLIWKYSYENIYDPQSTPTIDGDYIYALNQTGNMLCLNKKNGRVRWSRNIVKEYQAKPPHYGISGSPVIAGDLIILTANTAGMALSKHTGEQVWGSVKPPEEGYDYTSSGVDYSSPVVYERGVKRFAVVSGYFGFRSVDTETGKPLWAYDWGKSPMNIGCQVADPVLFGEKLFVAEYWSGHPGAFLLDIGGKNAPELLWTNTETNSNNGSPVVIDGYIYVCQDGIQSGSGSLRCLDAKNGEILWEEMLQRKPITLMASDGKLIILDGEGRLFIAEASPHGYKEISRCAISESKLSGDWWTPPVLCRGKIYCRSNIGDLVCIDVSKI